MKSSKLAVQVAHASMAWIGERLRKSPEGSLPNTYAVAFNVDEVMWLVNGSFAKIVLGIENETELRTLVEKTQATGLEARIITDAGHTEFGGVPTVTCAGIGPATSEAIDAVTGHLKTL